MGVVFKTIERFPGYRFGSDGSVWRCVADEWIAARQYSDGHGYLVVNIKRTTIKVHRLILEAFVGPCPPGQVARHFPDSDRTNNGIDNLQWGTCHENSRDKFLQGHPCQTLVPRNPRGRVDPSMALVRAAWAARNAQGMTLRDLGLAMGYSLNCAKQGASQFLRGNDPCCSTLRRFAIAIDALPEHFVLD